MTPQRIVLLVLALLVVLALGVMAWVDTRDVETSEPEQTKDADTDARAPEVVAEGLQIPWDIAFLPDGNLLVTERRGRVLHIESGHAYPVEGIVHTGEAGLLGIALHPDFSENHFVYLYLTTSVGEDLVNNVARYVYENNALTFDRVILDNIPASRFHDGGRIEFDENGMLYVTVGDAGNDASAQDTETLNGTILRVTDEGEIPSDNPFGNAVYSYGHRNSQGLAWDEDGRLWSTEHGRSGVLSGYDEVNLITAGGNYGWPDSEGDTVAEGTVAPKLHSGGSATWAPASAAYHDGSLYFGGLRGEALYEAVLAGDRVVELREHIKGEYGRIRAVRVGPDGMLYLTTSNRDGRGDPEDVDDRIIRLDPRAL